LEACHEDQRLKGYYITVADLGLGHGAPNPVILVRKEEMTEARKASI